MAMMSTARLIEKMKRLGTSIGSQTSDAPVSLVAQPPSRAAAAAATTAVCRTLDAIVPKIRLLIDNLDPFLTAPERRRAFTHNGFSPDWPECRIRTLQFEVHRAEQF